MRKIFTAIIIFILLISTRVHCEIDTSIQGYPEFNEYVEEFSSGRQSFSAGTLIENLLNALLGEVKRSKKLLAEIMVISASGAIIKLMDDSHAGQAAHFTAYTLVTACVMKLISEAVGYGSTIIHSVADFITKLAPVLLGLVALSGSPTSAAVFSPVLSAAVYILTIAVDKIITPMIYMSAVIGIIGNFHEKVSLNNFNRLLRSISRWILTLMLTLFVSLCAVYGFNSPVFDALGAKTVKFAVGTLVPVVGGLLADSLETVIGGTNILKNAVGSAGMVLVVLISAVPIIKVWVILFMLKLCAAISEPVSDRKISALLSDAGESVSIVFSLMITSVMMFLICIGIIIASTGVR